MKKIAIMLIAAVAAFACTKPVTPSITGPTEVIISQDGSQVTFKVTSTVPWTANFKTLQEWATFSPKSGEAGETEIKVVAEPFTEPDIRETAIVFTGAGVVTEIPVYQLGLPTVKVWPEVLEFTSAASDDELTVSCNAEFQIAVDKDAESWLEVTPLLTKSLHDVVFKVSVKENPVYAVHDGERYGKIVISSEALEEPFEVAVYQDGISTSYFKANLSDVVTLAPTTTVAGEFEYGTTTSLAILGDNLIVCGGDGSAPTVLDKKTGANKGKLAIGDIKCYSVANDDAGHLLISNRIAYSTVTWAYQGGNWQVYYMSSITDTPHILIDTAALPYGCVGATITCRGDVTDNALIGAPTEFPGLTACNEVTVAIIKGGKQDGGLKNIAVKGHPGLSWAEGCWNTAPNNFPAFAFKSVNPTDGALIGWYDENHLWDVTLEGVATVNTTYAPGSWAANLCSADIHDGWLAYACGQFFPEWALKPEVNVYGPDGESYYIPTTSNGDAQVCTTADVAIEAAAGGANVFYCDYNCNIIEGMFIPALVK